MKLFRPSTLLSLAGAVAAGSLLFWTSQSVQKAEDQLDYLNSSVQNERQSIRVLQAEWSYLNAPDRLELLASEYLGMKSGTALNVSADFSGLPEHLMPVIPEAKPEMAVQDVSLEYKSSGVPVPRVKPPRREVGQSFNSLLRELNDDGGQEGAE